MPAPLAKGLIISLSVLIAAGIAVYENPQVRQWVDTSRRKIAIALHSLGDEISPHPPARRSTPDPSTRPDDSPEAEERRRRARQEILERGRALQEKRNRRKKSDTEKSRSFDDLVDKNGSLINEKEEASTTAADTKPQIEDQDLRRRNIEVHATTLGSATTRSGSPTPLITPDIDRTLPSALEVDSETISNHSSEALTLGSVTAQSGSPAPLIPLISPASVDIDRTLPSALAIDTETISNHSSEALIDLTPTTSNASAADAQSPGPLISLPNYQDPSRSVHEWAENSSSSFYSYLEEHPSRAGSDSDERSPSRGEIDSDVRSFSHVGTDSDMESEDGQTTGTFTPRSWSEIGSAVSEDF